MAAPTLNNCHKPRQIKTRVPYWVPFYPDVVGAHQLISRPARGVSEYYFQMFHQKLENNLLTGLSSQVMESAVFPTRVNMFLQRKESTDQPMGGHTDFCHALLFQMVDFVGQNCNLGKFVLGGLLTLGSLDLKESAYKGREDRFMVLAIKPSPVLSMERSLHRKIEEASTRVGL
jgi:hypothetical protein